ncbi:MAG: beta-ketoacyl synthase chain length factor [Pseudomonadota bacterium]
MVRFSVEQWAAWSPGLPNKQSWLEWVEAGQDTLPVGEALPALAEMPAAMQRRADKLGRAALQSAYWCDDEPDPSCPLVFASRYGEMQRSVELLEQLAAGEPLSPATFSVSVHNAVGALLSIARGQAGNYTAIAAGEETVEAAFSEALGLLGDGAPAVTVVYTMRRCPRRTTAFPERAKPCMPGPAAFGSRMQADSVCNPNSRPPGLSITVRLPPIWRFCAFC